MIPVLYPPNATDFSTFGLGVLTDTISCEVTEERNGVFECLLKYPVSGQHYGLITKECIVKAKPNDTAADQAFRIYRITKPLNGIVTIYGQHISYDLANVPVLPFSTDSRSPQLILSQLLSGDIAEQQGLCRNCLKQLEQTPHRRKRYFCSDACRMAWWNAHPEKVNRKAYYKLVCKNCGEEFESYGNNRRTFCSRLCYTQYRRKEACK